MYVYVLYRYHSTPDNEGNDVLGVYYNKTDAQFDMIADAHATKSYYPQEIWDNDMTWESDNEIHLGFNSINDGLATIHCWEIKMVEVV